MRKLLFLAALLVLAATWSCHLGTEAELEDYFSLKGDSAWLDFDSLSVVRVDSEGEVQDTLFHGPLTSLGSLKELPAGGYDGGGACFVIRGFEGAEAVFEQSRCVEQGGGPVVVDTLRDPDALPVSLTARPDSLELSLGDEPAEVRAEVKPAYAGQGVDWTVADTGIVSLETVTGGSVVRVRPRKAGSTVLIARSRKDASLAAEVQVRVRPPRIESVELDRDSLILYVNGGTDTLSAVVEPMLADPALVWSSGDTAVAMVDSSGRITPGVEGRTVVRVRSAVSSASDSAMVIVRLDVPRLLISTEGEAAIHSTLIFSARVLQEHGGVVLYAWDLDGDGSWDDSLSGPSDGGASWSGDSVDLPAVSRKYDREGEHTARFLVRDTEGNEAETEVVFSIANLAPEILTLNSDTVISIKDSVPMAGRARDRDGRLARLAWDYDGDGENDDSKSVEEAEAEFRAGRRYDEAGTYRAAFRAVDDAGREAVQSFAVRVELDPPVADAGRDTTVGAGSALQVSAKGTDGFGSIAKRELKVGNGGYVALSRQDTSIRVPSETGTFHLVVRVTDDDGLSDEDTAVVTVVHRSNAALASLTLTAGSLQPAFDPEVLHYSSSVGHEDSMVAVVPGSSDAAARISVNGQIVASGSASASVRLGVEGNDRVFRIVVTAQDGRTQMEYDVSIYRAPSGDATLSALAAQGLQWKPAFSPSTFEYRDTVAYTRTTVNLVPTASHSGASITVEDDPVASGAASAALPLALGPNTIRVGVTAQDGTTRNAYTVHVERRTRLNLETRLGTGTPSPLVSLDLVLGGGTAIAAPAQTGYRFTRWSAMEGTVRFGDSTRAATTASVLAGVGRARAQYDTNTYALRVTNDGNGTTNPSGRVLAKHFIPHPISASPATGFRFRRWVLASGSATFTDATAASTTVRLTDSAVVGAEFERLNYTLSIAPSGCQTSGSSTTVAHGVAHALNATASCSVAACPNGTVILRFTNWEVTAGSAALSNAQSRTSSVTLSSGNATLRAVYQGTCE
jgi:hypothetical protein